MASTLHAATGAVVALLFWTLLGFSISRRLLSSDVALPIAPALGWAVHSAASLLILLLLGFSAAVAAGIGAIAAIVSSAALALTRDQPASDARISFWAWGSAAVLALAPAAAVAPEHIGESVVVAKPIFDHAKVPIIDAITRVGLPPANPFFGELGERGQLAYYYLWHFSAAQLAIVLGLSGWEADIALTWFSAFSSLALMMGLAMWFGGRSAAPWAVLFAATGSLRFLLWALFGAEPLDDLLQPATGFAGWLFQSAWVPQHLMSACCAVIAVLFIGRLAGQASALLLILALVLVVVAGFGSSTWIGAITFPLAALLASVFHFLQIAPADRRRFALRLAGAAVLSLVLAAPLAFDQIAAVAVRGGTSPLVISHFAVLGDWYSKPLRTLLDLPAYWLLLLPVEFPATYVTGVIAFATLLASRKLDRQQHRAAVALGALAVTALCVSWLLVSTVGENNDLGLRAVVPAAMILIVFSAAGLALWLRRGSRILVVAALCGLVLGFPDAAQMLYGNLISRPAQPGAAFAQTPAMWEAVRRHAGPAERVANNPLFLADMTPWPVNLSWALLSNRSSCFAGRELALAYAPLSAARREEINALFVRVFAGEGNVEDVRELATRFGCRVVVVTAQDNAWGNDPFAASGIYQLVETAPERWRIYIPLNQLKPRSDQ
jgi:hypothetical protein